MEAAQDPAAGRPARRFHPDLLQPARDAHLRRPGGARHVGPAGRGLRPPARHRRSDALPAGGELGGQPHPALPARAAPARAADPAAPALPRRLAGARRLDTRRHQVSRREPADLSPAPGESHLSRSPRGPAFPAPAALAEVVALAAGAARRQLPARVAAGVRASDRAVGGRPRSTAAHGSRPLVPRRAADLLRVGLAPGPALARLPQRPRDRALRGDAASQPPAPAVRASRAARRPVTSRSAQVLPPALLESTACASYP